MTTINVRFAPSPTGKLHVGNIRLALINWLFAKKQDGYFILRIDDTDCERSSSEYEKMIIQDLMWLGLTWDFKFNQSERIKIYDQAIEKLKITGRLYPCYETPEELKYKRKHQLAKGTPPIYDREALTINNETRKTFESEGRKPHWRFKLKDEEISWNDLCRGFCRYHVSNLSDPILIRADGSLLYTLPSVVDDSELNITHVIRGEDHVTNTATQIQIFLALGTTIPQFAHLPLLTDDSNQVLSKRLNSFSISELRTSGIDAMALTSLLSKLGTSDSIRPHQSLIELISEFNIEKFSRATPKFNFAELKHLNSSLLHEMSFEQAKPRIKNIGICCTEEFWIAIRNNLSQLNTVKDWWYICYKEITPIITNLSFTKMAAELLPQEPWVTTTIWNDWIAILQQTTGYKGRNLFHPLRLALTGCKSGPGMKALLPIIGRSRAVARLNGNFA